MEPDIQKPNTYLKVGGWCNNGHFLAEERDIRYYLRHGRTRMEATCRRCNNSNQGRVRGKRRKYPKGYIMKSRKASPKRIWAASGAPMLEYLLRCGHTFLHQSDPLTGPRDGDIVWCRRCDRGAVVVPYLEVS